jgi:hypothetical protein
MVVKLGVNLLEARIHQSNYQLSSSGILYPFGVPILKAAD